MFHKSFEKNLTTYCLTDGDLQVSHFGFYSGGDLKSVFITWTTPNDFFDIWHPLYKINECRAQAFIKL